MGKKQLNKDPKEKAKKVASNKVIEDERFSKVHSDPRFVRPSKIKNKVKVDERFKSLLTGDMDFQTSTKVDKYGRKQKGTVKEDLSRFYDMEKEDEDEEESGESSEEESEEEGEGKELDEHERMLAISRGELLLGSDSDASTEEEYELEHDYKMVDETIPRGDETNRFACMNMDWDNIKAKDLFKVFNSFKPEQGSILSVKIYPSQFGKERMEKEQVEGPPKEIFEKEEVEQDLVKDDDGEEFNQEKLKLYQLERLKYYYAVVECDSMATAKNIYDQCDENEYESSANFFDLRFIPEDMEFEDEPRDAATEEPLNYKASLFTTNALTNSKVELTWDNDDPERVQLITDAFTKKDIDQMNFDAFLASASEDEADPNSARAKYLNLIKESKAELEGESDGDEDMEIKFTAGLSERNHVHYSDEEESVEPQVQPVKEETSVEKYLRKQREKLQAKKELKMHNKQKAELIKPTTQQAKHQLKKEQEQKKAELELLLMDPTQPNHFDMEQVIKAEKKGRKRNRKNKELQKEDVQQDFQIDTQDPRFQAISTSNHFHIDPTHPQFKKTKAMQQLLDSRHQNLEGHDTQEEERPVKDLEQRKLTQLVQSVKNQAKKFQTRQK